MSKLIAPTKSRYSLLLFLLVSFITIAYSCNRAEQPNVVSPASVTDSQLLGTVSISIYNSLGIKNEESIVRQLEAVAQKKYPGSRAITNIRYDKSIAYADVVN